MRLIRKTVILAKPQPTPGTDPIPTGGSNAIRVSNVVINALNAQNEDRELLRDHLGASEQLVGTAYKEVSFNVEFAGSGAAGTAPAWGVLLQGCGMDETVTASTRVEYLPVSDSFELVAIYVYDHGVLHKFLDARGSVRPVLGLGGIPMLQFRFLALDGGDTADAPSGVTYANQAKPLVVTNGNTGDLTLGCTYSTGSLSGGTGYASRGLELDLGNTVVHTPLLGEEAIDITGREVTGTVSLDLDAVEEVSFMATVKANSTQGLGLVHGTTAGNIVGVFLPNAQLLNPRKDELNGRRMIGFDVRGVPGSSGNDELRIWTK